MLAVDLHNLNDRTGSRLSYNSSLDHLSQFVVINKRESPLSSWLSPFQLGYRINERTGLAFQMQSEHKYLNGSNKNETETIAGHENVVMHNFVHMYCKELNRVYGINLLLLTH